MKEARNLSLVFGNTIEIHYWFWDNTHTMDAVIQNRCEREFLGILKELAVNFNTSIQIETEPLANGGIRRWFKIIQTEENKKSAITTSIIASLAMALLVQPITTSVSKITEKVIDEIFEDKEFKNLEKQKLKLEIEKLKQETFTQSKFLPNNNIIKKRKSNFYEIIENYPKINRVSFTVKNEEKKPVKQEEFVDRNQFKEFILESNELEPVEVDTSIEIISPVLKMGNYKWMGLYKGAPISFAMKSKEFKNLVQKGSVQFKNGTTITCSLVIKRKLDNDGIERVVGYEIIRVNGYFENNTPIETTEGKKYRQKKENDKQQLELFANN